MKVKMKRYLFTLVVFLNLSINVSFALDIRSIKLQIAKMENVSDVKEGLGKCNELLNELNKENFKDNSIEQAEQLTWQGIVLAKIAFYKKPSMSALSYAKDSRKKLELAIAIKEDVSDGAALNALGMLYHNVPPFVAFGNDEKAEEYFKKAIKSNNIDTHWRYGEFLIDNKRKADGIEHLKIALSLANKNNEADLIKVEIIQNKLDKYDK